MGKKTRLTPNTHLGDVHWCIDSFFGSLLFEIQRMLNNQDTNEHFLDTARHSKVSLLDLFDEYELKNGCLGLCLYQSDEHMLELASIETTLPYAQDIDDQTFFSLIDDFVEYVRSLPLADPSKREGALWTDDDVERGYCIEANQRYIDAQCELEEAFEKAQGHIDARQKPI